MLPTKLKFIWESGFRGDFQKSTNHKQEWSVTAMFVNGSDLNEQYSQRTFHKCFLPNFGSFGQVVSEEKIFKNRAIRNKNCLLATMFVNDQTEMHNLYRGPSRDAYYEVSVDWAKRFQRRSFFRNQPIRKYNCLWRPCLSTDRTEMSKFRFIWPSGFRGEDFLEINQSETRIVCGGHVC